MNYKLPLLAATLFTFASTHAVRGRPAEGRYSTSVPALQRDLLERIYTIRGHKPFPPHRQPRANYALPAFQGSGKRLIEHGQTTISGSSKCFNPTTRRRNPFKQTFPELFDNSPRLNVHELVEEARAFRRQIYERDLLSHTQATDLHNARAIAEQRVLARVDSLSREAEKLQAAQDIILWGHRLTLADQASDEIERHVQEAHRVRDEVRDLSAVLAALDRRQ